jgi:hypothetical protein
LACEQDPEPHARRLARLEGRPELAREPSAVVLHKDLDVATGAPAVHEDPRRGTRIVTDGVPDEVPERLGEHARGR